MSINEADFKIHPYIFNHKTGEIHYAVFQKYELIAYCSFECSAKAVRNDAIQRALDAERSG